MGQVQSVAMLETGSWKLQARCRDADPELFFPDKGAPVREARALCNVCPVREECLQHALDNDETFGIWGGLTLRERRRLKSGGDSPIDKEEYEPPPGARCQDCGVYIGSLSPEWCDDCLELRLVKVVS